MRKEKNKRDYHFVVVVVVVGLSFNEEGCTIKISMGSISGDVE